MRLQHLLQKYNLTLLAFAIIVIVAAAYWQTFSRIVEMWSISYYEYGWLVYPISVYVLARKRDILAQTRWGTSKLGILLVALLVLVWVAARAAGIQVVEFVSATSLIFASFWAIAGTAAMRKAAFPLLLLIAAVPMGAFLVEPLMSITAEISSALLTLTGVPVVRDGQFFHLQGGSFEVADVCSGFKYLLAGMMASLAFSYVTYSSNLKRLLFIGVVAVVVVITNGVRAFIVMSVASATEMKILGGSDHVIFGMVLFAVAFIAMIWIGEGYADPTTEDSQPFIGECGVSGGAASGALIIVTLVIVMAGPHFSAAVTNRGAPPIADLPLPGLERCQGLYDWTSDETAEFPTADYQKRRMFACGDYQTSIYIASYGEQRQGKELISWANRVWPNSWRRYVDRSTISIRTSGGSTNVKQVLVRHPEGWRLIWYWYQVGSTVTSSQNTVKLLEALRALTLQPVESSIVVVSFIGSTENRAAELREQLERHADRVMSWNRERVELGTQQ